MSKVEVNNIILQKKHYYMQLLQNAEALRKNTELEVLQDDAPVNQLNEVMQIWNYSFVGLLREGLTFDYIKNTKHAEKDIIRLTIDNVHFDCPAVILKEILSSEYDNLVKLGHEVELVYDDINLSRPKNDKQNVKTDKEIELEKEIAALKEKAAEDAKKYLYDITHDSMTALKNKKAFTTDMDSIPVKDLAVISIDANNLKTVNDSYGHKFGDIFLKGIAGALLEVFAENAYRIGGDEFAVLLNGEGKAVIKKKLDALHNMLEDLTQADTNGVSYSVSAGYAVGDGIMSAKELLEYADKQMYLAKAEYKQRLKANAEATKADNVSESDKQASLDKSTECVTDINTDNNIKNVDLETKTEEDNTSKKAEVEDINENKAVEERIMQFNANLFEAPVHEDLNKTEITYNNCFEKMKDSSSFVYDMYDLMLLPPGASSGERIKAIIAPVKMSENDTHPDIMAMLVSDRGNIGHFVSENGLASLKIQFGENEFLLRGSFVDGNFRSYIVPSGTTMAMGFNLNKNVIEYRASTKEDANFGHVAFKHDGYLFHIVPTSTENDKNGVAPCLICVESVDDEEVKRMIFSTAEGNFTIFTADNKKQYQIFTYWQNELLCAEVLNA